MSDEINRLTEEVYCELHENISDVDIAESIMSGVNKIVYLSRTQSNNLINSMSTQIDSMKTQIEEYKKESEKIDKYRNAFNKLLKPLFTIRTYMNNLFDTLWNIHKSNIEQLQPNYGQLSTNLKRPDLWNRCDGVKLALCVINNIYMINNVSQQLCQFYLRLNDAYHPRIKPENVIVIGDINFVKVCINDGIVPDYYTDMGLTLDILNELEQDVTLFK